MPDGPPCAAAFTHEFFRGASAGPWGAGACVGVGTKRPRGVVDGTEAADIVAAARAALVATHRRCAALLEPFRAVWAEEVVDVWARGGASALEGDAGGLPRAWVDALLGRSEEELDRVFSEDRGGWGNGNAAAPAAAAAGDGNTNPISIPPGLLAHLRAAYTIDAHLPHLATVPEDVAAITALPPAAAQGLKPKKLHELSRLAPALGRALAAGCAAHGACEAVWVDVGGGKGHLVDFAQGCNGGRWRRGTGGAWQKALTPPPPAPPATTAAAAAAAAAADTTAPHDPTDAAADRGTAPVRGRPRVHGAGDAGRPPTPTLTEGGHGCHATPPRHVACLIVDKDASLAASGQRVRARRGYGAPRGAPDGPGHPRLTGEHATAAGGVWHTEVQFMNMYLEPIDDPERAGGAGERGGGNANSRSNGGTDNSNSDSHTCSCTREGAVGSAARLHQEVASWRCRHTTNADAAPQRTLLVTGLHACGTLSNDLVEHAVAMRAEYVVGFGCCYQRLALAETHDAAAFRGVHVNRSAYARGAPAGERVVYGYHTPCLATRGAHTLADMRGYLHTKRYRCALCMLLAREGVAAAVRARGFGSHNTRAMGFAAYARAAAAARGLADTLAAYSDDALGAFYAEAVASRTLRAMLIRDRLRETFRRAVEVALLADRALWAMDVGGGAYTAALGVVFDRNVSPHNIAIVMERVVPWEHN